MTDIKGLTRMNYYKDADSTETQEWLAAFESVVKHRSRNEFTNNIKQY